MMVPFDGNGPQQGQPSVAQPPLPRPPMPPGQHGVPSQGMPPGHHQQMNPPPYGHRNSGGMPGQPHYMPPQSPANARQTSFGSMPGNGGQYSSHPPLHSPHQQQGGPPPMPPHPNMAHPQQMHRSNSLSRQHSANMGQAMPMPGQHEQRMSSNSQGSHNRQQQYMGSSSAAGNWQSDKDTPHRRDMIQHM